MKLGLKLLQERARVGSFWWPYIGNLPEAFNVPIFFPGEDIKNLQYAPVVYQVPYLAEGDINESESWSVCWELEDINESESQFAFFFNVYYLHSVSDDFVIKQRTAPPCSRQSLKYSLIAQ